MRYAIYWLPHNQSPWYQYGKEWFAQTGKFQTIIEKYKAELSYYDFAAALKIPQKYGFHAEILPPFSLKPSVQEHDIVKKCHFISKLFSPCDIKMCLMPQGKSLLLKSYHQNNLIYQVRQTLHAQLLEVADFEPIFNFETEHFSCCQDEFQITISNTPNTFLQHNLAKIAAIYWQDLLKGFMEIKHFNLCYQKDKNTPFFELARFNLNLSRALPALNKSVSCC